MMQRLILLLALAALAFAAHAQTSSDAEFESGKHYFPISPAQPTHSGDQIEVIEVFGYPCIHCAHAEPFITKWEASLPKDVKFVMVPAVFGGIWEAYARVFFTAETMGVLKKTHAPIFKAIHEERRKFNNFEDIAGFYAEYGVDKEQFVATLDSFAVNAKIADAQRSVTNYGVEGTPTMIVNGKYRVVAPSGQDSFQKMLDVVDYLVARERAEKAKG
jgi:thiol:disulfide interchange protein DsbA